MAVSLKPSTVPEGLISVKVTAPRPPMIQTCTGPDLARLGFSSALLEGGIDRPPGSSRRPHTVQITASDASSCRSRGEPILHSGQKTWTVDMKAPHGRSRTDPGGTTSTRTDCSIEKIEAIRANPVPAAKVPHFCPVSYHFCACMDLSGFSAKKIPNSQLDSRVSSSVLRFRRDAPSPDRWQIASRNAAATRRRNGAGVGSPGRQRLPPRRR